MMEVLPESSDKSLGIELSDSSFPICEVLNLIFGSIKKTEKKDRTPQF